MSTNYYHPDGEIVSGRGTGDYVYCFRDQDPIRLKYNKLESFSLLISEATWYGSDGTKLWCGQSECNDFFEKNSRCTFTPQTVARIDILASTTTGPSASNFVKGTLIGGVALGAAAAMAPMGNTHTVKVTWKDDLGSNDSIITFNNNSGFQNFIGKLGSLMNQPNEATPALSTPAFSSADEILKFKKLMDEGIITQAEFEAKKKQLLGIENPVVISSEVRNPEYYAVLITSFDDCKSVVALAYKQYKHCDMSEARQRIDRATLPFEIIGTTSKTEAEEVAKKFSSTGAAVEIRQPKSDGGSVVTKFKNGYAIDENQPKTEIIDLEAKHKQPGVGDEIYFGSNNGQRMTWKVLERQGRMALVITTDIVCNKQYHSDETNITWSECTLRKWLNSDFISECFTQVERDIIVPWELNNDDNPKFKTPGGVRTTDKVFLLSIDEARTLFADDQERALGFWWLRSSGVDSTFAATVVRTGEVNPHGLCINSTSIGVRPALWIDLASTKWNEEAKKRFDDYWEVHSDERKKLEAEQKDLKDLIDSLKASCNEQIEVLEKELATDLENGEIDKFDAIIKKLTHEKNALAIFKVKERQDLQHQIYLAEAEKSAAKSRLPVARAELKAKISAVQREFEEKISSLQIRINRIDTELNKER
ncbi:Ribosomal protein L7/L12 C-terminal domain-containing protein [Ruminococcaceae bacterium YAD3003]|nr:Ribosomal protein L7/L12 C-terminal domain-containing protein [Ruminococcaceae bacterium YAD3003]